MAWFEYKAKDSRGQIQSGNLQAESYQEAQSALRNRSLQVLLLKSSAAPKPSVVAPSLPERPSSAPAPSSRENSGLPWIWDVGGVAFVLVAATTMYFSTRAWGPVKESPGRNRSLTVAGRLDYSSWRIPPKSVRLDVLIPDASVNFSTILNLKGGVSSFSQRVDYISLQAPMAAKVEISSARQKSLIKTVALNESLEKVELGTCTLIYQKPAPRK